MSQEPNLAEPKNLDFWIQSKQFTIKKQAPRRLLRRAAQRHEPGAKSSRNSQNQDYFDSILTIPKRKRLGAYSCTERRGPEATSRRTPTISITRFKLKQFSTQNQRLGAYSGAQRREPGALDLVSRDRLNWESAYARACSHRTHARTYAHYSNNCFTDEGVLGNKNARCCSCGPLFRWGTHTKTRAQYPRGIYPGQCFGAGGGSPKKSPAQN